MAEKKRLAAKDGKILTVRATWSPWRTESSSSSKERTIVQRILALAIAGYGIGLIVKKLNADKLPSIARSDFWAISSVNRILKNRAC